MARSPSPLGQNKLLGRLPKANRERVLKQMEPVSLKANDLIYEFHGPIKHSYFPLDCVLSAVTVMQDGAAIEVATVGNEGAVGLPGFLATEESPHRVFTQIAGDALRITSTVLRDEARRDDKLGDVLARYAAAFLAQVSASVACNGLHPLEKRCSRWLLLTHDRLPTDELPLTHEFLAMMLGVRRAGVSEVLQSLERGGLIRNTRGVIVVADRKGLEAKSCECYRTATDEYYRLLG